MADSNLRNEIKTSIEGQHLFMERSFQAPRELVFELFSQSEHLESWWGPEGWETETYTFSFQPGGVWQYCMCCTDESMDDLYGQKSYGKWIFHKIEQSEKIIYTDLFTDENGLPIEGMPEIVVTLTFTEEAEKTKLMIQSQFSCLEDLKMLINMGVVEGFTSQFGRLDEYLKLFK